MKTLYLTNSYANICIDSETETAEMIDYVPSYDINRIYYIDEPMHVIYSCGETKAERDVKKGDIVITFDRSQFAKETPFTVIKSKEWNKIIKNRRDAEQKAKEEWAENKCNDCSCCESTGCDCADLAPAAKPVKEDKNKKVKKSKK